MTAAYAEAGSGATPQAVAMHYLAPELARYITGTSPAFLKDLAQSAQPIADRIVSPTPIPTVNELAVAGRAFKKLVYTQRAWGWSGVIAMSIFCGTCFPISDDKSNWLGFLFPFFGPGFLVYIFVSQIGTGIAKSSQIYKTTIAIAARILAAEREKSDYWRSLSWRELELRVSALFERKGYRAFATPGSGDRGVDVIAESSSEKIVIQCKQYSSPAQRNLVSELLGVMIAERADRAILLCTGGFSKGAIEYARENAILLWNLDDLVRENANNNG